MGGLCIDCQKECPHVMMVGQVEVGSGPGWIVYACPAHARRRAQRVTAPAWLRDDVAALDAEEASGGGGQ